MRKSKYKGVVGSGWKGEKEPEVQVLPDLDTDLASLLPDYERKRKKQYPKDICGRTIHNTEVRPLDQRGFKFKRIKNGKLLDADEQLLFP